MDEPIYKKCTYCGCPIIIIIKRLVENKNKVEVVYEERCKDCKGLIYGYIKPIEVANDRTL